MVADIPGCKCTVCLSGGCKVHILAVLSEERQRRLQLQRITTLSGGYYLQPKPVQVILTSF